MTVPYSLLRTSKQILRLTASRGKIPGSIASRALRKQGMPAHADRHPSVYGGPQPYWFLVGSKGMLPRYNFHIIHENFPCSLLTTSKQP